MIGQWAVIESIIRSEIKPFGACYRVINETSKYIIVEIIHKDEIEEKRIFKKKVICYSSYDLSPTIETLNKTVRESYDAHVKKVNECIETVKKICSNK